MPRKPTLKGKNTKNNIPKGFRCSGGMNHLINCSFKTMMREGQNYLRSAKSKKSDGHVQYDKVVEAE